MASSQAHFDVVKALQGYIHKILKPKDASRVIGGMKALLLDRETKTMVSMVFSMNEILSKEGAPPLSISGRARGRCSHYIILFTQ